MYPYYNPFKRRYKSYNVYGNFKKGRYKEHGGCKGRKECNPWVGTYLEKALKNNDQILESGYTVSQTWTGLRRAWLGYVLSKEEFATKRMIYYAGVIQKLQRELYDANLVQREELADFPQLKMFALGHKKDNAKVLHDEYTGYGQQEQEQEQEPEQEDQDHRRWVEKAFNEDGIDRIRL